MGYGLKNGSDCSLAARRVRYAVLSFYFRGVGNGPLREGLGVVAKPIGNDRLSGHYGGLTNVARGFVLWQTGGMADGVDSGE